MRPDDLPPVSTREGALLLAMYGAGRLSAGTATFAFLLTGRQLGGGLGAGGLAVAGYTAAIAVFGPVIARRADTLGPARVLRTLSWGFAAALLTTAAVAGLGPVALIVGATLSGALMPPLGPAVRATITEMYPESVDRTRALTAESVLLEVVTLVGPLIVVACAIASPRLGLVVAAAGAAVGGTALSRSPRLAMRPSTAGGRSLRVVMHGRVLLLLGSLMLMTGALSALEVAIVSFSAGRPSWLPGVLLALLAAGSILGGGAVVVRPLPGRPATQLPVLLLALTAGIFALTRTHSTVGFAVTVCLTALVVSPISSTLMAALGSAAAPRRVAETFGWAGSANYVGIAAWTAAGGWTSQASGTSAVLWLVLGSSLVAALLVLGLLPAVERHPQLLEPVN